jgi:hypothetical protein
LLPSPSLSRTTLIAFGITLALASSLSHATPVTVAIALIEECSGLAWWEIAFFPPKTHSRYLPYLPLICLIAAKS